MEAEITKEFILMLFAAGVLLGIIIGYTYRGLNK
jgi:hypothetical protein